VLEDVNRCNGKSLSWGGPSECLKTLVKDRHDLTRCEGSKGKVGALVTKKQKDLRSRKGSKQKVCMGVTKGGEERSLVVHLPSGRRGRTNAGSKI